MESALAPATAEPIAPVADLPIRFRAALLDLLILSVLQALLGVSVQNVLTLWLAYFVLFEGFFGATPAKEMFGLRVMTLDGRPCGLRRAIGRNLLRIVDWLPAFYLIGALAATFSKLTQRLGDKAAGTIVVVAKPPYALFKR
jgi:uncharacterized RDD family membrane protein YckC